MLLPEACDVFLQAHTCDDQGLDLEMEEGSVKFTSRWLLNQLILYLKLHLSFKCIHRRFGTLLYRTGGDLLTSLSWAHGTKRILHAGNKSDETYEEIGQSKGYDQEYKENISSEAGCIINDLLHDEIKKLSENEIEPKEFNFDCFKKQVVVT